MYLGVSWVRGWRADFYALASQHARVGHSGTPYPPPPPSPPDSTIRCPTPCNFFRGWCWNATTAFPETSPLLAGVAMDP